MKSNARRCSILILTSVILTTLLSISSYAKPTGALQEIVVLRTETSKHWQNEDGSYTAEIFAGPIHYKDIDNTWKEIDTTIAASARDGYACSSIKNGLKVHFAQDASGWSAIEVDGQTFSFKAEANYPSEVVIKGNTVTYPNAWQYVDLRYHVLSTGLKEELVIQQPTPVKKFKFLIKPDKLKLTTKQDGSAELTDETGKAALKMLSPYIFDSENRYCTDVKVDWVQNKDGSFTVILEPDAEWLAKAVYPVVLDPTVYRTPAVDKWTQQMVGGGPWYWYDGSSTLQIGKLIDDMFSYNYYACIKFDVSSIPANASPVSAQISLEDNGLSASNKTVGMAGIQSIWYPSASSALQVGSTLVSKVWTTGTQTFYSSSFDQLVTQWIQNSNYNNGIAFFGQTTGSSYSIYCYASECEVDDDKPKLTVSYLIPDTTPPAPWPAGSKGVVINDDIDTTETPNVELTLNCYDGYEGSGLYLMQISNDGVFDTEPWEDFAETKSWSLIGGSGTRTVYARFRDRALNISSVYSDDITLAPVTSDITFSPPAYMYVKYLGYLVVYITCSEPDVTIRYTVNGSDPIETNPNAHIYDSNNGVLLDLKSCPYNYITLKARATKSGYTATRTGNYYKYTSTPVTKTCQTNSVIANPLAVGRLRVTNVYMTGEDSKAVRIEWDEYINPSTECKYYRFKVARINTATQEEEVLCESTADSFYIDTEITPGTEYIYRVQGLYGGNEDRGLSEPGPDTHPSEIYRHYTFGSGPVSEIAVTPVRSDAVENQTVDSRIDTRYVDERLVDYQFGNKTYMGGLFVGYAHDPDHSRIGRSFLKFSLTEPPTSERLWAGSLNAFHTKSFTPADTTTTNVGCHTLTGSHTFDNWNAAGLKWSVAPYFTAAQISNPLELVSVGTGTGDVPALNWCNWQKMFDKVPDEMYGDHILSVALARTDEPSGGANNHTAWAYFAKKEFDSSKAPNLFYAYGHQIIDAASVPPVFPVRLELSSDSVQGGNAVQGTVYLNGPAPAGGTSVSFITAPYPYSDDFFAVAHGVVVPAGQLSATFNVSTAVITTTEPKVVKIWAQTSLHTTDDPVLLTITKDPQ